MFLCLRGPAKNSVVVDRCPMRDEIAVNAATWRVPWWKAIRGTLEPELPGQSDELFLRCELWSSEAAAEMLKSICQTANGQQWQSHPWPLYTPCGSRDEFFVDSQISFGRCLRLRFPILGGFKPHFYLCFTRLANRKAADCAHRFELWEDEATWQIMKERYI